LKATAGHPAVAFFYLSTSLVRLSVRYFPLSVALAAFPIFLAATPLFSPATAQQARPPAFAVCAGCHSTQARKTAFGPSLAGVGRRRAGTLEGYVYSPALKASGLTWNAKTLDRWLTDPKKTVPGTKMPFNGIQDRKAREQLIAYLLTL
jgi:cytochrome c